MIGRIAFAAAALLVAPAATAQSIPGTVEGIVGDLAYGYCPMYLAGEFPLVGNDQLKKLGFTGAPNSTSSPGVGSLTFVSQKRDGITITFGGVPDQLCQINIVGPGAPSVLEKVRAKLSLLPYDFKPDPANSGTQANGSAEQLVAKVDDKTVLRVAFIRTTVEGSPTTSIMLYFMDQ
ncbi:hypothetical protein FHS95_004095 [Sphingomonas naasensis]|uniref:Uncharacterized protein n=1 Tax=Sphingomonas naasensis TaxID=1344951 RepID=A0A4S1WCH5_9SPHN|nr:hypothetical protein [Sphingomonas naasensis]NIJ22380.1 hypothetical protein [Sphingomonas naasensis]TGX40628.1 hypothetical protein E5A74_14050 [Sphingomonas naasensis]